MNVDPSTPDASQQPDDPMGTGQPTTGNDERDEDLMDVVNSKSIPFNVDVVPDFCEAEEDLTG